MVNEKSVNQKIKETGYLLERTSLKEVTQQKGEVEKKKVNPKAVSGQR